MTSNGWVLAHRQQFNDTDGAVQWMTGKSESMQRGRPHGAIRGNIVPVGSFPTLETILAEYEAKRKSEAGAENKSASREHRFTPRQGQFLAFIYYYTKINGQAPAERDMERYFKISPPSVHQMVVTLEKKKLIARTPGVGRSIRLLVPREQLPDLE